MISRLIMLSFILFTPLLTYAHGGHGSGIVSGFTHPIFGVDHLVAILGAGFMGYVINPSRWYIPLLAFVSLMIVGGLLGIGNEATFTIEKIIALSVFVIGILLAFDIKIKLVLAIIILGIFGFFHGYAHGAEMSPTNTALKYISGYTLGTLLAGTIGMLLSRWLHSDSNKKEYLRIVGGVICGCGIMMLLP